MANTDHLSVLLYETGFEVKVVTLEEGIAKQSSDFEGGAIGSETGTRRGEGIGIR
jgi:hypothetical protein